MTIDSDRMGLCLNRPETPRRHVAEEKPQPVAHEKKRQPGENRYPGQNAEREGESV